MKLIQPSITYVQYSARKRNPYYAPDICSRLMHLPDQLCRRSQCRTYAVDVQMVWLYETFCVSHQIIEVVVLELFGQSNSVAHILQSLLYAVPLQCIFEWLSPPVLESSYCTGSWTVEPLRKDGFGVGHVPFGSWFANEWVRSNMVLASGFWWRRKWSEDTSGETVSVNSKQVDEADDEILEAFGELYNAGWKWQRKVDCKTSTKKSHLRIGK